MSKLKNLIVSEKITEVEYDDIPGFKLKIAYLSREELSKIRDKCVSFKYNRGSRQKEEVIDTNKFLEYYAKKVIRGWSGLKMKDLPKLVPVNIEGKNPEELVPYDEEDALELLKNSVTFDQFITDFVSDLENFEEEFKEEEEKN